MTYVLNVINPSELRTNFTISSKTTEELYTNISHCLCNFISYEKEEAELRRAKEKHQLANHFAMKIKTGFPLIGGEMFCSLFCKVQRWFAYHANKLTSFNFQSSNNLIVERLVFSIFKTQHVLILSACFFLGPVFVSALCCLMEHLKHYTF